ncbi:hypothetical protein EXU85_29605 [Spirosoma sp. KCTC 42546]|uniref:alpha/beta hydrolase family protein n=1 Tax=Spirosoma sp. KCTC 42546 TaxID=2520506 RepID=UPI00115AC2A7|nr:hypothetical protein [Spirosoma sp. KCTC 42546]QDK82541.1 hypothetical protein EXU85_29605 [Spirosoma sp. KCTC 42546]
MAQTQQSVSFTNHNQVLAGTLKMPPGTGVHPAVLIILGSGSSNRDGEVEGLKPFQAMTTELGKKGFAVLRYDNRSKGRSSGKPMEESTTTELATKRRYEFGKVFNTVNQAHSILQIKHVDHNLITTDQRVPKQSPRPLQK